MYYTYILQSLTTGRHYFGSCADLEKRLALHNAGKVQSSKAFRPYKVIYFESFEARSEAFQRELFFKTFDGRKWLYEKQILT